MKMADTVNSMRQDFLLTRKVLCCALAFLLVSVPVASHVDVDDTLPDGTAGCHEDPVQGYHCHETDLEDEEDQALLYAGALVASVIIGGIIRRNKKKKALRAGQEVPEIRLKDLLLEMPKVNLMPVENSLGNIDGAQVQFTFRF